jgi:hypothetical protein
MQNEQQAKTVFSAVQAGGRLGQEWAKLTDETDQSIVRSLDRQAGEALDWVRRQEGLDAETAATAMWAFMFGIEQGLSA